MVWGTGMIMWVVKKKGGGNILDSLLEISEAESFVAYTLNTLYPRGPGSSWERAGYEGVSWSRTRDESAATWWTNNGRPDGKVDTSGEASMDGKWSWGPDVPYNPQHYISLQNLDAIQGKVRGEKPN